ncbi:MAG: outer membrane protein assembly factor BamB family protein [Deltaproteobacteria bacterium]
MKPTDVVARAILASLLLGACRCGSAGLDPTSSKIEVAPTRLDFGNVYLRASPMLSFTVFNAGQAPDTVSVALETDGGGPFSLRAAGSFTLGAGGSIDLQVGLFAVDAGPASGNVHVAWPEGSSDVALTANGLAWPPCAPANACETATFDPNTGSCSQSDVADGTACDAGEVCLVQTQCVSGQCLGQLDTCGGGNACTLAYCVPGEGCHSQDQSGKCQGTDPCQIYSCDPTNGCQSSPAPDGTPCATSQDSCQTAGACLLGACVGVPVPDGTPCALWWAPCVGDAACRGGSCSSPTASALTPGQRLWRWPDADAGGFDPATGEAGGYYDLGTGEVATPLAVDGLGTSYLPYSPDGWTSSWAAIDSCGRTRWNVPWGGALQYNPSSYAASLVGDELVAWANDRVAGLAPASGALLWQTDLLPAAVQAAGSDGGFLSVYSESISSQGTLFFDAWYCCSGPWANNYLLIALDAGGAVQWTDEIPFDTYSIVSDAVGDAYFTVDDLYVDGGSGEAIESIDATGRQRFAVAPTTPFVSTTVIGANDVVVLGGDDLGRPQLSTFTLAGAQSYGPLNLAQAYPYGQMPAPVVDAKGTVYAVGMAPLPDGGTDSTSGRVDAIDASGALVWALTLPAGQYPISSPALGDGNRLFLVMNAITGTYFDFGDDWLLAIDTTTGRLLWEVDLGADPTPHNGATPSASLALTNSSMLLISNAAGITAYFAGQHKPPANAPWPREGGDNTNRRSPAGP